MNIHHLPWIWNSIKNKKESINAKELKIYLCGPTVYDDIHLGNLRPVIIFDFLIRYLRHLKINYTYIQNITDVDDKIINKAINQNIQESEVSETYKKKYFDILNSLNVLRPTKFVLVTEEIQSIIEVIQELIDNDYAYIKDGTVWFNLEKAKDNYMEISNQKIDNLTTIDPFDLNFALWKKTSIGISWKSPWGSGRPGWHLECFVFIKKFFGSQIDIHGGGIDLKFPHHENENIISHAIFKTPLSKIWMHVGHLCCKNEKISKSSGKKMMVVCDLLKKYSSNLLRYIFMLNSYEKPFDIDEQKLEKFNDEWLSFVIAINYGKSKLFLFQNDFSYKKTNLNTEFLNSLSENLNLTKALTHINKIKMQLLDSIKEENLMKIYIQKNELITHLEFLGFTFEDYHNKENLDLLNNWSKELNNKNYEKSDWIRHKLQEKHLIA